MIHCVFHMQQSQNKAQNMQSFQQDFALFATHAGVLLLIFKDYDLVMIC